MEEDDDEDDEDEEEEEAQLLLSGYSLCLSLVAFSVCRFLHTKEPSERTNK